MLCTAKKTVQQIHQQQQHYLIALKANQPTLEQTLKQLHATTTALSQAEVVDATHQRQVHRQAWVYTAPAFLQNEWADLKRLIWVKRWGIREGKPFEEEIGYISNLELSADEFLHHIQQHWGIENRLHWVRDVTFEEDTARPGGNAPIIWAILNCFLISIVRQLGFRTVPQGVRALTNQLEQVYRLLTQGFSSA
jgi:predicted transposase YbfD/YdcC